MQELNKSFTHNNIFKRIYNATRYSFKGLLSAFKTEAAFRQDLLFFVINTALIVFFVLGKADKVWVVWLFFCGIFLLITELINTAIEYIVDRIGPEIHVLSGMAKDVGSAIVFLAVINILISWIIFVI